MIPYPVCITIGQGLIVFGGGLATNGIVNKMDEDHKRKIERKKQRKRKEEGYKDYYYTDGQRVYHWQERP